MLAPAVVETKAVAASSVLFFKIRPGTLRCNYKGIKAASIAHCSSAVNEILLARPVVGMSPGWGNIDEHDDIVDGLPLEPHLLLQQALSSLTASSHPPRPTFANLRGVSGRAA